MSEWPIVRFEELADSSKSAFSKPYGSAIMKEDYRSTGVPVVRGVNLSNGIFADDDFVFISDDHADRMPGANLTSGDLVFTHRGTIGQVSMIPWNRKHARYVLSTSHVKARLDASRARPEFYYYYFRSRQGQQELLRNASVVGVPGIAQPVATIKSLLVPHPPLRMQNAIVALLGALDDKIAVNDRIASMYEEMLKVRFQGLRIDVDSDAPAAIPASRIVEFNPMLQIPRGNDAVYLDMAAVPTDRANVSEWTRREPKSGTRFANDDTVMARITPCLENGKTAFIDFMDDGEVGVGSTEFIVMRARPGIPVHVSYFLARSPRFRENAIRNMVGSSGRQRVNATQISDFPLKQPNEVELAAFGQEARVAFDHMRSLTRESRNLRQLRDTLLPKLMSGEIRVRDAERIVEDATR
jgi:type I restriction enzyme S subunit